MSSEIKVSIIVPSYKRDTKTVGRALNSLLSQTYQNIEIIVVDDNARPELSDYREQLRAYVAELNDPRIRYFANEENLGGSLSRNVGITNCTGEFVTFLDDDDRYLPEKVERQLKFTVENDLDMSFTDLAIYNEKEVLIDYRNYLGLNSFTKEDLFRYHLTKQITGTPTFLIKRSVLEKINGFDDVKMGQEYYLMVKLIQSGCKIGYMQGSDIVAYRDGSEAISTGPNKISGERKLYHFKKNYFSLLTLSERRYVRCRHYAVMAVAYKRNKKYFQAAYYLSVSVLCAPILALKEANTLLKKRKTYRK